MAEPMVVAVDPPPSPTLRLSGDFGPGLSIPPLDTTFFSEHLTDDDGAPGDNRDDIVLEDLDFDFSFDDLCLPSSDDLDDLFKPTPLQQSGSDPNLAQFTPSFDQLHAVFKSTCTEMRHLTGDFDLLVDQSWEGSGVLSPSSPEMESQQISGYLNMPSPESNGSNPGGSENGDGDAKVSDCHSPESQGSGNFESNVSEDTHNLATRSVSSSPNSSNSSVRTGVVDQKIKPEEPANNNGNNSLLKRKKDGEDLINNNNISDSRTNKYRKSNCSAENNNSCSNNNNIGSGEEEEKRKARLLRNRESAQLSRQRKKHYVDELEDKVRTMHSTIQDLNAKISYFMAENATLRQQMGGGGGGATGAPGISPPPMAPPPPGIYPHPAMMYPWMPCPPPYMVKSPGSQVPLVPIPRLKTQQPTQAPKTNKKVESKKSEVPKTKKVASVSFLGLLFFIMLFGGLVPMVNVKYGGVREAFTGGESYMRAGFSENHRGRILMVNGTGYGEKHVGFRDSGGNNSAHCGQRERGQHSADEFVPAGNGSEPLAATLYVPRNDKLVKIDGNLIIHSVLATEKAMASREKGGGETGLVISRDLVPAVPVSGVGRNGAIHPNLRALASSSVDKGSMKSTASDGRLQQWFREGLAGPMLSAGLCTEVFQFDISAAGAIIPATTTRNISEEQNHNSTHPNKGRNRRILHPIPLPEPSHNISREQHHHHHHAGRSSEKENLNGNKNASSMVVSVLFDPREAGDADVDGVMGAKSLSRIFVVVLIDSVKYVTYSCMLPFTGSGSHVVTA